MLLARQEWLGQRQNQGVRVVQQQASGVRLLPSIQKLLGTGADRHVGKQHSIASQQGVV